MAQEQEAQEATPSFTIEKLYVKDLSLEVPNAPAIFLEQESPEISVQLQTGIQGLSDDAFEVTLTVTGLADETWVWTLSGIVVEHIPL